MGKLPDGQRVIGTENNKVSFYCEMLNDNIENGKTARNWISNIIQEGTITEKEAEFVLTYWLQLYGLE